MITLLKFMPSKKKGFIRRLFSSPIDISCRHSYGVDICTLCLDTSRDVDWRRVVQAVGGEYIIPPIGFNLPEAVPFKRYNTQKVKRKILTDAAVIIARLAADRGAHLSVMLIDKTAEYIHLLGSLLSSANTVTVVTDMPDQYNQAASEMLSSCGASPITTDDICTVSRCDMVVAPFGITGCGTLPLPALIFAPSGYDCACVTDSSICFDGFNGYSPLEVLAAMQAEPTYDQSGYRLNSLDLRGKSISLNELACRLSYNI